MIRDIHVVEGMVLSLIPERLIDLSNWPVCGVWAVIIRRYPISRSEHSYLVDGH